jgi:hypothetical protein
MLHAIVSFHYTRGANLGRRPQARRKAASRPCNAASICCGSSGLAESHAWVSGFGGTMGWDGEPPSRRPKEF